MKELKPGGGNIIVTEENKKEYVKHYVNHRFMQVCVMIVIFPVLFSAWYVGSVMVCM